MKKLTALFGLSLFTGLLANGGTTIINDDYTVTSTTTGFALNNGVNFGINPPTTRLSGSAAANLRYLQTFTNRLASHYDINSNRLRITTDGEIGRFTLSANGSSPFDFGPSLGVSSASVGSPVSYDVKIGMRNDATGNPRFSLGLATVEGDINNMDFAVQLYRANGTDTFYTIQKRIDRGSFNGTATTDGTGDLNAVMGTTASGTVATMVNFLIRVTDAGSESGGNYNSRIQVSTNNGTSWIYDTASDASLPNGFRFDGAGRYVVFDQAPNNTGNVFYDSFSITWNSGPRTWTGAGANGNWSNATNWGGATPVTGSPLKFNGSTRLTNTNDISGLVVPSLTFGSGGFSLYGSTFTNSSAITNVVGVNTLKAGLEWSSTAAKSWNVASGTEVVLDNTTSIETGGDHTLSGGGTLRTKGTINVGVATTANPAFVIERGTHILDGGSFNSRGGYRVGANAGSLTDQTTLILTNGATMSITAAGSNIRVGNSTNGGTGRLEINNSTLTLAGGALSIPYTAGSTGVINQVGGTVSGGSVSFSDPGAGTGSYTIQNGTLETLQISKNSPGGNASMFFDNATLRPSPGASSPLMAGLNTAQIQAGGLTIDATSAVVVDQALSGSGALVKSGSAQLTLNGNNAFSGGVTLNAGSLSVGHDSALGSGTATINGGTILGSGTRALNNAIVVGNDFTIGGTSALTLSGAVNLGSVTRVVTVANTASTTFSGVVSGAGGLTKDGSGVLELSGAAANTFSGSTLINAGTLSLAKSSGVNAVTGNVTVGDGLGGAGVDVLQLNAANQISDSSAVTISASGLFNVNGFSETVGSLSSGSASAQVDLGAGTLTVGDAASTTYAGSISGSGNLTKRGAGKLTLTGSSTFSGTAAITGGVLNIQNSTALGSSGATVVSSGTAIEVQGGIAVAGESLTLNGSGVGSAGALRNISGNNSWSGAVTLASGSEITSDSGTLTISGNIGGAQALTVDGAGNTTISSVLASGALTKEGTGTLQLSGSGANTYTGGTVVNAGMLTLAKSASVNAVTGNVTVGDGLGGAGADIVRLSAAEQIPDSATVTISASGRLDLNGSSETVAGLSSSSGTSQVTLGAGTLIVNGGASSTFAGVISGTGGLVKKGAGTLTLSGANTYSGATTIDSGKLVVASGGSIASSTDYAIANGATLDVTAISFAVGNGESLGCSSSFGKGNVDGNLTFSSGASFTSEINGAGSIVGKLAVDGNLTLNSNTVTINVTGAALNIGNYCLISFTGSRTGTFNTTPVITGSGLATGLAARIQHTSGVVSLFVYNPSATNTFFKVMQYNIHYATHGGVTDTTDTSNFILNQNIDLVSMNEVDRFRDRSHNRDLPAEFAQKTGMTCVYSNLDLDATGNQEMGNAILSDYPVLYRENILLPRVGDNEQRGLLKTVVDIKGKFLSFWSTHLDFHAASDTERLKCVTNFNKWVTNEVYPVIICGDFNDSPGGPAPVLMQDEWDDTWPIAGDGTLGRTVPCPGPTVARIDYIWKVKGSMLTPTNAFVALSLEESDHYGIVEKFHLNITTNRTSGFYLRFDEGSGTNILDSVGLLKGTMGSGAPTWSTDSPSGLPGDSSLYFNGTKKLTITDPKQSIGTNGVNDNYTLQAWVKVAVNYAPAQRAIMFQYDRKPGFSFSINTNRTLHTTAFKVQDISSSATLPNDGQWHHVAVVHTDGTNMKFYIDGALSATVAYTGGAGYRVSNEITVGSDADGANPFTGYLARLKFDNRALTPSQFDSVAAAPQNRAASSTSNPLTTWQTSYGIGDLNGDSDGDGQSNYAEYLAKTNPTNAASALRVIQANNEANGEFTLTWSSVGGVRYRVQYAEGGNGVFTDIERGADRETDMSPAGQPSTQTFTDVANTTNNVRFYRVKVVP